MKKKTKTKQQAEQQWQRMFIAGIRNYPKPEKRVLAALGEGARLNGRVVMTGYHVYGYRVERNFFYVSATGEKLPMDCVSDWIYAPMPNQWSDPHKPEVF